MSRSNKKSRRGTKTHTGLTPTENAAIEMYLEHTYLGVVQEAIQFIAARHNLDYQEELIKYGSEFKRKAPKKLLRDSEILGYATKPVGYKGEAYEENVYYKPCTIEFD